MTRVGTSRPATSSARIRFAAEADAVGIAAIYAPIVQETAISFEEEPPGADEMARRLAAAAPLHPWLVAVAPGSRQVVGYAASARFRRRAAYRWVVETSVYVDPGHQRRSVASHLYVALLGVLTKQGYRRAVAGITLPNDPSLAFHRRHGFRPLGTGERVGWKHGRWRDVAWMQRDLGAHPPDAGPPDAPRAARTADLPRAD